MQTSLSPSVCRAFLGCQIEKAVDELNLSKKIISCHPSSLPLPDHVDCFVALNRSPSPYGQETHLGCQGRGVSGSGLLCRTSLLAFLFTRPAFNRGRGCRFFEVFCGYGDHVPTCKITMRNKHAFSYCTYNWLHDFLVGFALLRGHH